ncbi:unnamed protein product, partial [Didymodactylos carnosus]
LGKIDSNGELYFVGRVDFQIKLRGQRIEIGEIERIILNASSNVTNCVVIKYQQPEDQEHLIAYVQSSSSSSNNETITVEELKRYCQQYLPLYMIPTWFIILEQLPLNTNGKVDRKQLPKPDFSQLTQQHHNNDDYHDHVDEPNGEMEIEIHALWCRLLSIDKLSMKSNFFSMGGNSLLLMKLYNYYLSKFSLNQQLINIAMLFKQSTIIGHVQLLKNALFTTENGTLVVEQQQWKPLNITQGKIEPTLDLPAPNKLTIVRCSTVVANAELQPVRKSGAGQDRPVKIRPLPANTATASFVQERIWYNEKIRFDQSRYAMFNMPFLLKVVSGQISIRRLKLAISHIINKNSVLRTSLNYDSNDQCLKQTLKPMLIDDDQHPFYYTFECITISNTSELEVILFNEETCRTYFDLDNGIVFRCRIIRCSSHTNKDLLATNDYVLFNFHHIAFDGSSVGLFFNDLRLVYCNDNRVYSPEDSLQYIDYSQYEKKMDVSKAKAFWKQLLDGYDLCEDSQLPYDYRLTSDSKRTGLGTCITFQLDKHVVDTMSEYAQELQVSMFQLCLAFFFVYLFKLSNGKTDQCVGSVNANRYREELQSILGMFVNLSPYRLKIDPELSFHDIVLQVQQLCLEVLQYAYLPYQEILLLHGQTTGNRLPFIETFFQLESSTASSSHIILDNDTVLRPLLDNEDVIQKRYTSKYDLSLVINYDFTDRSMKCSFSGTNDLYTPETLKTLSERYQILLSKIFISSSDKRQQPLKEL